MVAPPSGVGIERFRIVQQIGKGGMGEVYVAWDEILGRKVALKSIRAEHRLKAEAKVRFLREARVLSQLRHPNICEIHDYIEGADADFLVLELIEGRSLSRAIRDGLSPKQQLSIAIQIADVLVVAHERGVVHRDLKPDNVMLTATDAVKVLDFGLSRSESDSETIELAPGASAFTGDDAGSPSHGDDELTQTHAGVAEDERPTVVESSTGSGRVTTAGAIVGTLGHMSPEQARGETATSASDLYSFGLLLQELFTAKPAYPRELDRLTQLRRAQEGATAPIEGVDSELSTLIRRLEAVVPSARPSAAEARERLVAFRNRPGRRRRKALISVAVAALVVFSIAMAIQTVRATKAEKEAKAQAARANREAEASRKVSDFLLGIFKVSDPGEARGNSVTARELLDRGAARIDRDLETQPEVRARLMDTMGLVYLKLGLYPQAEPLLRRGLAIRTQTLGPQHPDVAQSLQNLGMLCWSRGRYPEAEELFRSAVKIRERSDTPDLAKSLNNLAIVYKTEGKLAQAEPLYVRSFRIIEKTLGADSPEFASSLNNLASFYYAEGKLADAEPLLRRSLQMKEKTLGPDHPDVAIALNNLGELQEHEKKYAEAESAYRRSLEIREKIFGPQHPDVAESFHNLGTLYVDSGRVAEAEPLILRSLAMRRQALGPEHPDVARTMATLALLRSRQHHFDEAERLYVQAVAMLEKAGESSVCEVLEQQAQMAESRGETEKAASLRARVKELRRKLS